MGSIHDYGKYIDAVSFKANVFRIKYPNLLPIIGLTFGLKVRRIVLPFQT
jgi:hypothetical protein